MHAHRLDAYKTAPETIKLLREIEACLHKSALGAQLVDLTTLIGMTNLWNRLWNRLAIGLRYRHPVDARAQAA